jgi:hypothetical protein
MKRIKKLGPLPEGTILATQDVTSLFIKIPNNDVINDAPHCSLGGSLGGHGALFN